MSSNLCVLSSQNSCTISIFLSLDALVLYEFLIMWVHKIRVRSKRLNSKSSWIQARSRIRSRVSTLWWSFVTEPTYLIIRFINHGGLSQNSSIWPADSDFSSVGPSSCMPSYSTTTRNSAGLISSSSRFSSCYSYVLLFVLLTNSHPYTTD